MTGKNQKLLYKELFLTPKFENIPDGLKELPWAA